MAADHDPAPTRRHRPKAATVFIAAFVAGAAAAVGINRVLDVHLAQAKPQVECEPIFVALRSLPQGVPVTVWDVALRDWPKAMMPVAAVRVSDSFAGCLLKHPLREGQPLLTVQLLPPAAPAEPATGEDDGQRIEEETFVPPMPATVMTPPAAVEQPAVASTVVPAPAAPPVAPVARDETAEGAAPAAPSAVAAGSEPLPAEELAAVEPQTTQAVESAALPLTEQRAESPEQQLTETTPTAAPLTDPEADQVAQIASQPTDEVAAAPAATTDLQPSAAAEPNALTSPEPTVALVRQEPTPAAEPPLAPIATAPAPAAIGPQLLGSRPEGFAPLDLPSRPAADIATLPSVMARDDGAAPAEVDGGGESSVRFLVVPERIAQQADTSFTTPAAPTVASVTPETRPTPTQEPTQQPAAVRQPGSRQTAGRQANGPATPNHNRGPNRTATNRSPNPGKQPQAAQPKPTDRATAESSSWGSMFPNVSAGIEAIGKWRTRGKEAVADEPRSPQPRR